MPDVPDVSTPGLPRDGTGKIPKLGSAIGALLAILESRLDRGELTLTDPVVGLAREHVDQAVALGVDHGYRKRLDSLLSGLATPQRPQTPHLNGVLRTPATDSPSVVPALERRQNRLAVSNERRSGQDARRRFKRFVSPALLVSIRGRTYRTMDWSIGGLLLAGSAGDVAAGEEVTLRIRVEALPGQAGFEDRATVVRRDVADGWFSLRFKSGTSATLKVLELLSRNRISPSEPAAS